ncbi:MAG: alpha-2-macroglobulin family protein, partial [Bacteroidales bacterium]|nr:alpha-2-macroglobulin family protein [Bacteroidales bacterium]
DKSVQVKFSSPVTVEEDDESKGKSVDLSSVKIRKNFNETAFFYPFLQTNEEGDVIISFTAPEALTKWKFMGFAHTRYLKYGFTEKEIVTQKDLMLMPNAPRFFREGDKIIFSAKISNISTNDLSGTANLILFDATTMKPIDSLFKNLNTAKSFEAKKGQSAALNWELNVPQGIQAVTYRIVAKAGNFSDGEEMTIPVLPNRMLVTESLPLPVRGKQTKDFLFANLLNSKSSATLVNHKLTLEYTSNPAWYAVQALPYLMEYPYECAEQVFSRYYANSIASVIANSNPKIMAVFDSWKKFTPDAFLSNLQKNQELKSVILEETPWVLDAKDENKSKQNIALLFDLNKMSDELERAMKKLQQMQTAGGAWPWFAGMPDDRYVTQHIVTGMGHLKRLGIKDISENKNTTLMTKKAIEYLDNCIKNDYDNILKYTKKEDLNKNHLSSIQIQYLYARSYFIYDYEIVKKNKDAFDYFKNQAKKYWLDNNKYLQGMLALAFNRMNDKNFANDILKSLKEKLIYSEEMGAYWKDINAGYYWHQAPIETQALMIEAFDEIANDAKTVEELKIWLLKQKQTQNWKTTKATVEACYALLLRGTDFLADDILVKINLGNIEVDPNKIDDVKVEAGTGYFKTSWSGNNINPEMGKIKISKTTDGIAWGALYWQYFEQLDKIKTQETNLKIQKKLFIERNTPTGPVIEPISETNKLKVGDKIIVRIEIRSDRDMEYVHLKDMRASGTEPINVLSQYKYQGGLGYYESTKDASTNFFISYLPKGTYVFEYSLKVTHNGDFSNGITTIQCMYAPEFTSHSEGVRITVE